MTEAVEAILQSHGTTPWVVVAIDEHEQEIFHQERPGRPTKQTKYRRELSTRYQLRYELDHAALAAEVVQDGIFPLITNVLTTAATVQDDTVLPISHTALAAKGLLPAEHLVDCGVDEGPVG